MSIKQRNLVIYILIAFTIIFCLFLDFNSYWYVILPFLTLIYIILKFWFVLWNRDKMVPLFEIGVVCMAAMAAYTLIPILSFLYTGGVYNPLSSLQLQALSPTFKEFGSFVWYYVVYVASFAVVYLPVRGHVSIREPKAFKIDPLTIKILIGIFIFMSIFFKFLQIYYGVNFYRSYDPTALYSGLNAYLALPHFYKQIVHNLFNIQLVTKMGLLAALMAYWRKRKFRALLALWLLAELVSYLFNMGARTYIILMFMSSILLYHRLVNPFRTKVLIPVLVILLTAFFLFGLLRGGPLSLQKRINEIASTEDFSFTTSNEFEALLGGAYDLYYLKQNDLIQNVPWQIRIFEFLLLIPQQLLPFEKVNPQQWYLDLTAYPSYFMFNPVAQSIVGLGWIEIVMRGVFLGWLFARIHRWYVHKATSFWRTLFYLFLTVWSYYTIRSSTFMFVYFVFYHFVPLMIVTVFVRELLNIKPQGTTLQKPASSIIH